MEGETLLIVGKSGCGKSILQLVRTQSGNAALAGRDLFGLSKAKMRTARRDPFASLDLRQTVGRAIAEPYLAHGLSYLFISHDMTVVERISHRVAVLLMGEIVKIGPREAIFGNPQHPYFKRVAGTKPSGDGQIVKSSMGQRADRLVLLFPCCPLEYPPVIAEGIPALSQEVDQTCP